MKKLFYLGSALIVLFLIFGVLVKAQVIEGFDVDPSGDSLSFQPIGPREEIEYTEEKYSLIPFEQVDFYKQNYKNTLLIVEQLKEINNRLLIIEHKLK